MYGRPTFHYAQILDAHVSFADHLVTKGSCTGFGIARSFGLVLSTEIHNDFVR